MHDDPPLGFIGLGVMGGPMALNLVAAGRRLVVWNRSPGACAALASRGKVEVARTPDRVFAACSTVILMLAHAEAMDEVLARGTPEFEERVRDRTVVNMGTTSPAYSAALARDVEQAQGRYVEAPVSGSRQPAEAGQLVAMLAGDAAAIEALRPELAPMCRATFACGAVPSALLMKLSVNLFLITLVTGLCESFHFAQRHGLDPRQFQAILDAGPMASGVSRMKLPKLVEADHTVQASIVDVAKNSRLVVEAARQAGIATPLMDECFRLFGETLALALGSSDMVAVVRAIEARTDRDRRDAS